MFHFTKIGVVLGLLFLFNKCGPDSKILLNNQNSEKVEKEVVKINYSVSNEFPHDFNSFTEGLLFFNSNLYESTGSPENFQQTKSCFGIVNLNTGKIDVKVLLDKTIYFGEGIVILNNKIYQLTYKNQIGFIYDAKNYKKLGQFFYTNKEGWGLTSDGSSLIMSDGTNNLTFLNPIDFKIIKTLSVSKNGFALDNINELEYIKGFIYANIWQTNTIVKINPTTGEVKEELDLTSLFNQARQKNNNLAELNGIAFDSITDKIFVTGKMWPTIYELKFTH